MKGNQQGENQTGWGLLATSFEVPSVTLASSVGFGWAQCRSAFEDFAKAQGLDHGNFYACEQLCAEEHFQGAQQDASDETLQGWS